ncbi:MerR family transcriptional regulator [Streptomyces cyaneofuscatus]|uniref:MerR family transcriptional regulator n=1 Tax=Streptomyces cyaneofuscatus TaxID=66883 RepID=UPI00332DB9A4
MTTMLISQLAKRTGVPSTTLRFYEKSGILQPAGTSSGYRVYSEDAVERLAFICTAKHLGLPLDEIADLLKVRETGNCAGVRTELRSRLHSRIADAHKHSTELRTFGTTLRRAVEHLDGLPTRPGPCDPNCDMTGSVRQEEPDRVSATFPPDTTERWRSEPVACSLPGSSFTDRAQQWSLALSGASAKPIDAGLQLTLPIGSLSTVTELAVAEQQCCPFYDFRIQIDGGVMRLEVRAPQEGATILKELFTPQP